MVAAEEDKADTAACTGRTSRRNNLRCSTKNLNYMEGRARQVDVQNANLIGYRYTRNVARTGCNNRTEKVALDRMAAGKVDKVDKVDKEVDTAFYI